MPLVVVRTNLPPSAVPKDFMQKMYEMLIDKMNAEPRLTVVEVQAGVQMLRGGSLAPTVTLEMHHSDDYITEDTKRAVAQNFAKVIAGSLKVNMERILVLFFDTRCTTIHATRF